MDRQQRQRQFRQFDLWFQRLHAEHPILFNLLAVGIGLVLFGLAVLLKTSIEF
jgi:hypothetical protein